jgi:hypothetical protein
VAGEEETDVDLTVARATAVRGGFCRAPAHEREVSGGLNYRGEMGRSGGAAYHGRTVAVTQG